MLDPRRLPEDISGHPGSLPGAAQFGQGGVTSSSSPCGGGRAPRGAAGSAWSSPWVGRKAGHGVNHTPGRAPADPIRGRVLPPRALRLRRGVLPSTGKFACRTVEPRSCLLPSICPLHPTLLMNSQTWSRMGGALSQRSGSLTLASSSAASSRRLRVVPRPLAL